MPVLHRLSPMGVATRISSDILESCLFINWRPVRRAPCSSHPFPRPIDCGDPKCVNWIASTPSRRHMGKSPAWGSKSCQESEINEKWSGNSGEILCEIVGRKTFGLQSSRSARELGSCINIFIQKKTSTGLGNNFLLSPNWIIYKVNTLLWKWHRVKKTREIRAIAVKVCKLIENSTISIGCYPAAFWRQ